MITHYPRVPYFLNDITVAAISPPRDGSQSLIVEPFLTKIGPFFGDQSDFRLSHCFCLQLVKKWP